jgi:glutamate formiminotransferase / 5-formyltetrahydrofolate cyclo-ligase
MNRIAQCVPNISEGRDVSMIDYIVEPLKNQNGFKLISVEPDPNYHRTVITLIGDPHFMIMPLIEFFRRAIEKIDMRNHHGEHPRMGAVDVVPFIPISNITMEECVEHAKDLAIHVSYMHQIPVYLYAKAATSNNRVQLPDIRKGEFEGMATKITESEWKPDYGKAEIHPSFGVVAIGARMPLVAYNIDLNTTDEKIASHIAKAIRQSSGGFQYIQAGPATLSDLQCVQVTMNILDYKKNPIYRIFETVAMEAKRFQVSITGSEVIGLIPKEALMDTVKYYMQCENKSLDKQISLETLTKLSVHYLKIRGFSIHKIIEANL